VNTVRFPLFALLCIGALFSCSFDYGDQGVEESTIPDITMRDLEYARVKNGQLQVRLAAGEGDRYDKRQVMELRDYRFRQYDTAKGSVDAEGRGGFVQIELDNLALRMEQGVVISVESEDLVIETDTLTYNDKDKKMAGPEDAPVTIERSEGTEFRGRGFSADIRSRVFSFSGGASGIWVQEEDEADEEEGGADAKK
jgi:LPS export ABC transporter protein LptC